MLNDVFVCRYDGYEFVIKEEENDGILYSFKAGKEYDRIKLNVNWIVYLTYCKKYDLLLGASYGEGKVFSVKIKDGKFYKGAIVCDEIDNGRESRSHSIILDRNEEFAYSANLGLDKIFCYKVQENGLKLVDVCSLPKDSGPRHMMFNKEKNILYCISEISNDVFVLEQNISTGALKIIESHSILPESFSGESYGGTLTIQKDNKYLYLTNRGANTIALFEILKSGKLNKVADIGMELMNFYRVEENVYGI